MTREPLELLKSMARHAIGLGHRQAMEYADDVMALPADTYSNEAQFALELDRIFGRLPTILGPSCELANPGDFKTMKIGKASIIVARDKNGQVRGYMNACRHRGVKVTQEPCGNANRFVCPFHGWTFGIDGKLIGVSAREDFGEVDKAELGLREFPVLERAGLIWAIVNPDTKLSIEPFLKGYDDVLALFGFSEWKFFSKRSFKCPNWKLSFDGYLEYYHVPVLHGETFGRDTTNRALYYTWGPHQHIKTPDLTPDHVATETLGYMARIADLAEADWDLETMSYGVWTVFPCISIASFGGGGRGVMISQVLPGERVGESTTYQYYIMENLPATQELADSAEAQFAFLQEVVEREDIAMAYSAQDTLPGSRIDNLYLGRNELGNQNFHSWVAKIVAAEDDEALLRLFRESPVAHGVPPMERADA